MPEFPRNAKPSNANSTQFGSNKLIKANEMNDDFNTIFGGVNGAIDDFNIAPSANIAKTKLALAGTIQDGDIATGADIQGHKLAAAPNGIPAGKYNTGSIVTADIANDAITIEKISGGFTSSAALVPTLRNWQGAKDTTTQTINGTTQQSWTDLSPTIEDFDVEGNGANGKGHVAVGASVPLLDSSTGLSQGDYTTIWLRIILVGTATYVLLKEMSLFHGGQGTLNGTYTSGYNVANMYAIAPIGTLAGQVNIDSYTIKVQYWWAQAGVSSSIVQAGKINFAATDWNAAPSPADETGAQEHTHVWGGTWAVG